VRPLLAPEEMGRADAATIAAGTGAEVLMERAGAAVAGAALRAAGGRYGRRAVVVCGKGNNVGDGFVAARLLRSEGVAVTCLSTADTDGARGAAAHHLDLLRSQRVAVRAFSDEPLATADVIVDAIFGTGFRGRAEGVPAEAIEAINRTPAPVVAVDIPSGVDGATGAVAGPAVRAAVTVAFAAEKYGTAVGNGSVLAGAVEVVDIGIAVGDAVVAVSEAADVARVLPRRAPDAHKRSGGAVALLAGSAGMTGAALLAARGAVRMGAGYASLGTTAATEAAKAAVLPEVLSAVVSDGEALGPEALERFAGVLDAAGALGIGPGLGRGDGPRDLVMRALEEVELPVVADADALNVLAGNTQALARRSGATVITPHPGEIARLLETGIGEVQADRLGVARAAARSFDCVVLLKGRRTVVAEPGGRAVVNPTGSPHLATAGTGDVLTGAVATLLAAGVPAFEAAWAAAYVHGVAGRLAAERVGAGVLAWDVAEALSEARAALERTGAPPRK
jgi:ADP-dependent NAD(P)H-hydrate dehydratase / NAD(P)H-hydrate epimerase